MDGRLAFCYSGQLRKLRHMYRPDKVYSKYSNIFFHTWEHENNPNLKELSKYFPSAKVEIETYDNFDQLIKNSYLAASERVTENLQDTLRYKYVQFYTVYESLRMALNSPEGETFKYFVRTRSDINGVSSLFSDTNLFGSYQAHEEEVTKQFVLNTASSLVNSRYSFFDTVPQGVCLTSMNCNFGEHVLFSDYHFALSREAVLKILNYSIQDFLKLASDFTREIDTTSLFYHSSSPLIWDKIFKHLGIGVINYTESGTHAIFRDGGNPQVKEFYGNIE